MKIPITRVGLMKTPLPMIQSTSLTMLPMLPCSAPPKLSRSPASKDRIAGQVHAGRKVREDMISCKILRPNYIRHFVLDEADEMLSREFKDQMSRISSHFYLSV